VRAIRSRAALLIGLLALAGCGGGGAGTVGTTATSSAPVTTSKPGLLNTGTFSSGTTAITIPTQTAPAPGTRKKKSPEQQPGGAGDETPIATQALFTGKGGKVSPSRVRVPPFIAVKILLQAKDEKGYTLLVNGKEVAVGEGRSQATLRLDGLRPGAKYVLHNQFGNTPKTLVIVANAEPGP
jgi:hypothetical protein